MTSYVYEANAQETCAKSKMTLAPMQEITEFQRGHCKVSEVITKLTKSLWSILRRWTSYTSPQKVWQLWVKLHKVQGGQIFLLWGWLHRTLYFMCGCLKPATGCCDLSVLLKGWHWDPSIYHPEFNFTSLILSRCWPLGIRSLRDGKHFIFIWG